MMTYNISMDNKNKTSTTRENKKYQKVCFIGHRRIGFGPIRERLKTAIENEIKNGCKFFRMGTHGEFDEMALSVCRELRKTYKHITIEVVITSFKTIEPIIDHDEIFGDEKYYPYADVQTTMYNIEEEHYKRQIIASNKQMVDSCDTLICYVNKKHNPSGAKTTMNYAKKQGKTIINIYKPEDSPTYSKTIGKITKEIDEYFNKIKKKPGD